MNAYILQNASAAGFTALIVAKGIHSPLEERAGLELELKSRGLSGTIMFDLLLSIGTKSRRFFKSEFDGEKLSTLELITTPPTEYLSLSTATLHDNVQDLDMSLLSRPMAFAIRKGFSFNP